MADELYPETAESKVKKEDEDMDLEEMLKKELEGIGGQNKSNRFSGSIFRFRIIADHCQDCVSMKQRVVSH